MRERVDLKSLVRENRPLGSVRGAPGNRRPYRDSMIKSTKSRSRVVHVVDPAVKAVKEAAMARDGATRPTQSAIDRS